MIAKKKNKLWGQDVAILMALVANVISWFVHTFVPSRLPYLVRPIAQEEHQGDNDIKDTGIDGKDPSPSQATRTRCVVIGRPGGVEQLRCITLKPGIATCGYNIEGQTLPFTRPILQDSDVPPDCVLVRNEAFSVNYADVCIRWGLYESANQFVGYPIVPGFDMAGIVERVGSAVRGQFQPGDRVMGCSLFGSYSSRVLVPAVQIRTIPPTIQSLPQAAAIPTVSLTALFALFLAGHYPTPSPFRNKAILIHSAAGGVGTMLIQISKLLGLNPIVGVVGRSTKVQTAQDLGCHVVIDKSQEDLWAAAQRASPDGYSCIMDSNGVATLQQSFDHLAMTGRLIVFGFHTNLPMGRDCLSPTEWCKMAIRKARMPKFDPMEMGMSSKAILAFNLSFFAQERAMLSQLMDDILEWFKTGKLQCPRITDLEMDDIAAAHELIQSGATVGKIVLQTTTKPQAG